MADARTLGAGFFGVGMSTSRCYPHPKRRAMTTDGGGISHALVETGTSAIPSLQKAARPRPGDENMASRTKRAPTIDQLAGKFLAGYAPVDARSIDRYRSHARSVLSVHVVPVLGRRRASSITAGDIERVRGAVAAERSPSRVVSVLGVASMMFKWGIRHGLIKANPCEGVRRPRVVYSTEFYCIEEVRRIRRASKGADPLLRTMILVALYTGLRKGELFGLRWADIDQRGRRIDVRRSYDRAPKSGRPRHLPLHPEAAAALRAWRPLCPPLQGLVFPVREGVGELRMGDSSDMLGLPELLARARVRPLPRPWHTLRHTFASHYVMHGGNLRALQEFLGHAHINATERYAHLAPDFLAAEMRRIEY